MTDDDTALLAWWVVADVGDRATHVRDDGEVHSGLRQFAPGTELWVRPPQQGDDAETVLVVGRHRENAGDGWVRASVPRRDLTGFRVRGVHSADVLRRVTEPITLGQPPSRLWEGRDEAQQVAARWNDEAGPEDPA